ncbi:MAG: enoyl-CoA hydratase/isomerase family protein [Candidatus Alcyoniella australis]|nr:enoyl-CoA hydratase/isomerase family protein [Candidatus Alcyoniella australis]
MEYEHIKLTQDDGVAVLTLDRPEEGNAINTAMIDQVEQACHRLEDERSCRALVIRGSACAAALICEIFRATPSPTSTGSRAGSAHCTPSNACR